MIKGRRVLVDDLSVDECKALVGQRVVACFERNDDEFDSWDIGVVVSAVEDSSVALFVRFDSTNEIVGIFPEEHIIILTTEE